MGNAVRQLQHCVTERGAIECVELFHQEQRKNSAGGYCKTAHKRVAMELAYQRRAEAILQDENCFKVYIVSRARCIYSSSLQRLTHILPSNSTKSTAK